MTHPSIPFVERATVRCEIPAQILDAGQHNGRVADLRGGRVEDHVDRVRPVARRQDRVGGVAREELSVAHAASGLARADSDDGGQAGGIEEEGGPVEGKRGLGSLVVVRRLLAEAVAAPARGEVVERTTQAVAAEKPFERVVCPESVVRVSGDGEGGQLGLDERGRVERLLVSLAGSELGAAAAAVPREAECSVGEPRLVAEPAQRGRSPSG